MSRKSKRPQENETALRHLSREVHGQHNLVSDAKNPCRGVAGHVVHKRLLRIMGRDRGGSNLKKHTHIHTHKKKIKK